jgi:hypothetical protein
MTHLCPFCNFTLTRCYVINDTYVCNQICDQSKSQSIIECTFEISLLPQSNNINTISYYQIAEQSSIQFLLKDNLIAVKQAIWYDYPGKYGDYLYLDTIQVPSNNPTIFAQYVKDYLKELSNLQIFE